MAYKKNAVSTDGTQTLTNKTLTSPVINTPTGIVKGDVGLGNVDNTSDTTKNAATVALTNKDLTSGTNTFPTFNQNTTGSAAKWTTARNLAGNSVDGSANVAFANKFIVQGTTDTGLSGAQFLGALGTGIVKNTTTTGVLSIAVAADFPTLNQNTTGSAATLTTPRAINGVNFDGSAAITVTAAAGTLTGATLNSGVTASSITSVGTLTSLTMGGTLAMGVNSITLTGSIGATGARATKVWATDIESTNAPTIGGSAATGSGGLVRATSPTLVTPALGTPSALVATNATGTATGLTSGITNALKSATTTVDVSSATAPSSGQVLTATGTTAATWQTPSAGTPSPTVLYSTTFETLSRFTAAVSGGTNTFDSAGLTMDTSATSNRRAGVQINHNGTNADYIAGSPLLRAGGLMSVRSTDGFACISVGVVTTALTANHFGFKIVFTAGPTATLYATQADGTTETASSALTTFANNDTFAVYAKKNGTSSIDYYWMKNGGSWSSATNLTTNVPTTASVNWLNCTVNNGSGGGDIQVVMDSFTYER